MKETIKDQEDLRQECKLASKFWGRAFSALTAAVYRENGYEQLEKLWHDLLCTHQKSYYREGLLKLGIPSDDPPAVAAAKYHYLSNQIGGLDMEYIEESPQKVWIRYLGPMWTYGGVAMISIPAKLRRAIFSAWHPRNGFFMDCPRLGYVGTKFVMEGDPYDEGYFMEYDHDLRQDEIMRFETVDHTPEFDSAKAPKLDPQKWPEARKLKAERNYSAGYFRGTMDVLYNAVGKEHAEYILRQSMRLLAVQYTPELLEAAGINPECSDVRGVCGFFSELLKATKQCFKVEVISSTQARIILDSFEPFETEASEGLRNACFAFQETSARMISRGHINVSRHMKEHAEIWDITDHGIWLY